MPDTTTDCCNADNAAAAATAKKDYEKKINKIAHISSLKKQLNQSTNQLYIPFTYYSVGIVVILFLIFK
tara:strand:- start:458 stop:664 length:207 start_codon:yes stop_codon:yes gene_type:complete